MADGHRYMQQSFLTPLPTQFASNNHLATGLLLNSLLNQFIADPSAAQQQAAAQANPAHSSATQINRGMYGQNHPQGHNPRLNGAAPGRQPNMPMFYNHVPQQGHPHQGHNAHHQVLQAGHSGHGARNDLMSHSTFSSGIMGNASPYTTNNLQNGHSVAARGGPAEQPANEHWQKQMRLKEESDRAHSAMTEQHQPHYYARLKAPENKGIGGALTAGGTNASGDSEEEVRRRPYQVEKRNRRQDWHNLDMSGQGLRALSSALFSYDFLVELYIASNRLTFLPAEIGKLRHLKILEASNNLLSELPPEIGMCTSLEKLLLFDNQIRDLPYELGSLYKLDILGIEGNPINPGLREEIVERGTKSLINSLLEQAPVPLPPSPRKPIVVQEDVSPSLERIKVMTWNILCDKFATTTMYGYTPTGALSWEYRKERILQEIRDRDVDMLCLQEIATDVFRDFFSPELAQNDYKGVHWPRPKAKTMNEKDAAAVDGCAIFYKGSKWILLDKQLIDYANIAINRPDMKNQHDIFNRVMPKDNIGIICFFESRRTGARVIVANTHLAWEPTLADVKLVQTAILMENITKYAEKYVRWQPLKDKRGIQIPQSVSVESDIPKPEMPEPGPSQEYRSNTDIPLIVCGDYNSTQESSVYELLSMGRVTPEQSDFGGHQYGNFTRDGVAHPFSMRSAYVHLNGTPDELSFTNYVPGFQEVIDYIWYSTNTLEVVELLGPPDQNHLKRVPGFPNYHFPADHIQIMAEFVIKQRKGEKVKVLHGGSGGSGQQQQQQQLEGGQDFGSGSK
ncbi:glucose-repressible alcohol dehydrogenase transcriptional effector [Neurospora tetrasperma FGSC 2508]|uniref:CCR4-Not complex 3'-5'-exoribonuclease subunit Ccr4 n=1 Tax=Neurospora tetrasperma (strain FGSC 2508 / ATCC MYA-4615 / P0657) TaxID=510951 RepID=F8MEE6_NEUT8|nr:glucose-repressible alcohol dehydrogenase transcriptional effector [Neurospora tetrasperma FGSC 2508]EGO61628.1 glucose-repressible alcohol dehydrogenase transcriptional effector [Neurospora tetrasperma FGSC 2508]EGZ74325.1 glucose-repressible alcohol dehydrogenase transcriptional effector [Neurospora tetrasperma FGSC 2509]